MTILDVIAWLGVILISLLFVPQIIKILKTKKTEDISIITCIFNVVGSCCMVIHGIDIQSMQMITVNTISVLTGIILSTLKVHYGRITKESKLSDSSSVSSQGSS